MHKKPSIHGRGESGLEVHGRSDTQRRVAETHKRPHTNSLPLVHDKAAGEKHTEASGTSRTPGTQLAHPAPHVPLIAAHGPVNSRPLAITHAPSSTEVRKEGEECTNAMREEDTEEGTREDESVQRTGSQTASPTVSGPHGNAHDWAVVPSSIERSVVPFDATKARPALAAVGGGGVDHGKLPLSTRRVCPTCLRPLDDDLIIATSPSSEEDGDEEEEEDEDVSGYVGGIDEDEDGLGGPESGGRGRGYVLSARHRRRRLGRQRRGSVLRAGPVSFLTPQYFVHLARTMPLAIEDGSRAAKSVNFTLSASPVAQDAARHNAAGAHGPVISTASITTTIHNARATDTVDAAPASPLLLSATAPPPFVMQGYVAAPRTSANAYSNANYYGTGPSTSLDMNAEPGIMWPAEAEDGDDEDDEADKTLELPVRNTTVPTTTTSSAAAPRAASSPPRGSRRGGNRITSPVNAAQEEEPQMGADASSPTIVRDHEAYGFYRHFFVELRKLGSGTFGGVYMCEHVMAGVPLGRFAVKKIPVGDNTAYLQHVLREVSILQRVKRHPNVVEYNHSWVEEAQLADFGPPVRCLFVLMEYANEGSLDTYLERHGTALSTMAVWYFFLSAVAGTAHLHQKNILHRDLKPQNLLLTGHKGRPPRVLVSDFGTAAFLSENSYERTGGTGTLEYMAPELFVKLPHDAASTTEGEEEGDGEVHREGRRGAESASHGAVPKSSVEHYTYHPDKASDMWSLGMILYYLTCDGRLPARREDGSVVLQVQEHSPCPRPPEILQLLAALLQRDPRKRPSCHDILYSTIAQSIIRGFHGARHFSSNFLSHLSGVPLTTPPAITHRPLQDHLTTPSDLRAAAAHVPGEAGMHGDDEEEEVVHLQSSRVQCLNSTLELPQPPLMLPPYEPSAERNAATATVTQSASPLVHSPIRVRSHTCDVAMQTDPVRFADD